MATRRDTGEGVCHYGAGPDRSLYLIDTVLRGLATPNQVQKS
jgi:hypothetical protein